MSKLLIQKFGLINIPFFFLLGNRRLDYRLIDVSSPDSSHMIYASSLLLCIVQHAQLSNTFSPCPSGEALTFLRSETAVQSSNMGSRTNWYIFSFFKKRKGFFFWGNWISYEAVDDRYFPTLFDTRLFFFRSAVARFKIQESQWLRVRNIIIWLPSTTTWSDVQITQATRGRVNHHCRDYCRVQTASPTPSPFRYYSLNDAVMYTRSQDWRNQCKAPKRLTSQGVPFRGIAKAESRGCSLTPF
jgi:hypothetical protein